MPNRRKEKTPFSAGAMLKAFVKSEGVYLIDIPGHFGCHGFPDGPHERENCFSCAMRFAALTARKGERGLNICGIRFGGYAGIFSAENVTADPVFSADIRAASMRGVFKII